MSRFVWIWSGAWIVELICSPGQIDRTGKRGDQEMAIQLPINEYKVEVQTLTAMI